MMHRHTYILFASCLLLAPLAVAQAEEASPDDPAGMEFFEKKIRPVLVKSCYSCHSAASPEVKGGYRLDHRDAMRSGGESGPAITPGDPQESLLLSALRYESFEMPPAGKLPDEVIADFEKWIQAGAPDPRDKARKKDALIANADLWSLKPLQLVEPQVPAGSTWPQSAIDGYVLEKLHENNLAPVEDAPAEMLLRRVYFDLIGLPPEPAVLDAFRANPSQEAYVAIVDELLASPQFGERWARHWLDVARFAESNGKDRDVLFPHAWRYRDYVIKAVQNDTPYDRFVTEQVAGDLIEPLPGQDKNDLLVATGFLALGAKPLMQRGQQFVMDLVDDQIDVVTRSVLGLTASCARCHDHKFDPIPTRDYYALAGIFTSTKTYYGLGSNASGKESDLLRVLYDDEQLLQQTLDRDKRIAELKAEMAKLSGGKNAPAKKKNTEEAAEKSENGQKTAKNNEPDKKARLAEIREELAKLQEQNLPTPRFVMAVEEQPKPADCKVHLRGEVGQLGASVPRGFIASCGLKEHQVSDQSSGRQELAAWLVDPANPLTARVAANRIWSHLFGRGIVRTVANFGNNGEPPSHPELLDYLALRFMELGWSRKHLIREIVLSRTYRLSSAGDAAAEAVDPDAVLLWHRQPRRQDAEAIRDAMLAASGQLDLEPLQASFVTQIGNGEVGRNINTACLREPFQHRAVYLPVIRGLMPEELTLFDFAEPSIVVGVRPVTNVPAQSLFFLNSPLVMQQSEALAARLLHDEPQNDEARIVLAYKLVLSRLPQPDEVQLGKDFLIRSHEQLGPKATPAQIWATYSQALFATAEFRMLN